MGALNQEEDFEAEESSSLEPYKVFFIDLWQFHR